jgi:predicted PurR-regulated permease PerM
MIDGPRALQWGITFFPRQQRPCVTKGLEKIGNRVFGYVIGQTIISGLFAAYVSVVLWILHVPMVLMLALVAGVLEVIPVVGISVSLMLGCLLGLTVSSSTALAVLVSYSAYHLLENYFLIPRIYGENLRISTLAVLLAMIAGGVLAGVVGAVVALPLVAAYPALEGLWLAPHLEPEAVIDHKEQMKKAA